MTHVPDWILNLAWAWQMAILFGVIITALLLAVFVNDLPMLLRSYRRRKTLRVERRRP